MKPFSQAGQDVGDCFWNIIKPIPCFVSENTFETRNSKQICYDILLHNFLRVLSQKSYTAKGFSDKISEDGYIRNRT